MDVYRHWESYMSLVPTEFTTTNRYYTGNMFPAIHLCAVQSGHRKKPHLSTCWDLTNKANHLQNIFLELTER